MARKKRDRTAQFLQVVRRNRLAANELAEKTSGEHARSILEDAAEDLQDRLDRARVWDPDAESFTAARAQIAMRQVKDAIYGLVPDLAEEIYGLAGEAGELAGSHLVEEMQVAHAAFSGVADFPLPIDEAAMMDAAASGAQSFILRRLFSEEHEDRGRGILERYGVETVGTFEGIIRRGVLTEASPAEMEARITQASPFLQGQPAYWATRIVRTETQGAYNRAAHVGMEELSDQLGDDDDVLKIWVEIDDDRTGSDSYAIHGQIRRVNEPFSTWFGEVMAPPNRPNDRATIATWRKSWGAPKIQPFPWSKVVARWQLEGRKGSPPGRPLMSTVDDF